MQRRRPRSGRPRDLRTGRARPNRPHETASLSSTRLKTEWRVPGQRPIAGRHGDGAHEADSGRSKPRSLALDDLATCLIHFRRMGHTTTVRLTEELAAWLDEVASRTGLSRGRIIRDQLERARAN